MFERIVVPLNGLPSAETAIMPAAEIARQHGGELHLVFVDSLTRQDPMSDEFSDVDGVTYHDRGLRLLAETLGADLGRKVVTARLSGAVVESIVGYVAGIDADLVVMATRGRTGWRRAWAGSVADDLLHALNGRLLLVRIGTDDVASTGVFRRILVGLDGSDGTERALDGARALAQRGKSTLVLARVLSPIPGAYDLALPDALTLIDDAATQSAVDDAKRYLDGIAEEIRREDGLDVETVVEIASGVSTRSAAARRLGRIARDRRIDLVSLTTRKRGSSRLLLRSVADRVLRDTHCALLLCDGRPATVVTEPSRHEPSAVTLV